MPEILMAAELERRLHELESKGEEGIAELIDVLIGKAAASRATDIHIDCRKSNLRVQYRVDGTLFPIATLSKGIQDLLIGRLKVISRAMSYKKRMPQDGHIEFDNRGEIVNVRSSFVPTLHGEKIVLRLPDESLGKFEIGTLGLDKTLQQKLLDVVSSLNGTLLLTGPSSSGKTTTIYSILKHLTLNFPDTLNICCIEDPVEAEIEGVNQTQLDAAGGLDYTAGLKAILRQDPNVIVIGEIRNEETGRVAVQAGLTGHFVISTIHSGTAAGVFTRLLNMKIEPFLVASSISCVIAQRLVRNVCTNCRRPDNLSEAERTVFNIPQGYSGGIFRPVGCEQCFGSGYKGRTGVFEMLVVSDSLRDMVLQCKPTSEIHKHAVKGGMKTLQMNAVSLLLDGMTSKEEISRLFFR
jgi:type II secretory ATPase GspE/PulE/Tfp pilus assembly ATPase PilB-like protein